jgi:hypothetical protein
VAVRDLADDAEGRHGGGGLDEDDAVEDEVPEAEGGV